MESIEFSLKNKTILVTGASSGIGRQIAIDASSLGARIIITGRNKKNLNKTFEQLKGLENKQIIADLATESGRNYLIENCDNIDGLVHSAGITENLPIRFIDEKYFDKIFSINYKSPVLLTSKLLNSKKINNKASIVFISSASSQYPQFGTSIYSSSKAALETFSNTLAIEYSKKQIRSNSLLPAFVETELLSDVIKSMNEETINNYKKILPFGFGSPKDVSNTTIHLLSENSRWITGQNIKLGTY